MCAAASELGLGDLHAGQTLRSASVTMTEAEIVAFAREFDPQPMHVDAARAAAGPMGGLIASGWHTASVAMQLQQAAGLRRTGLAEIASLAWPLPVRPGDTIHVEIAITGVEGSGLVHFENTAVNGRGETVQVMVGTVRVPPAQHQTESLVG